MIVDPAQRGIEIINGDLLGRAAAPAGVLPAQIPTRQHQRGRYVYKLMPCVYVIIEPGREPAAELTELSTGHGGAPIEMR